MHTAVNSRYEADDQWPSCHKRVGQPDVYGSRKTPDVFKNVVSMTCQKEFKDKFMPQKSNLPFTITSTRVERLVTTLE